MLPHELVARGQHVMTVCNACRYCEAYCPVFQAMEDRLTFASEDLAYLGNLCHGCGECLYACQYAPPHEFGIDVPRTLGDIRVASYEMYCWPRGLAGAFKRQPSRTLISLAAGFVVVLMLARAPGERSAAGDFYQVVPHGVMVALFSVESLFVIAALTIGALRSRRDFHTSASNLEHAGTRTGGTSRLLVFGGLRDALTLRHLHGAGEDCSDAEERRRPWRRWFHHCTFYGFALCFASTTVAAFYHLVLKWRAPYPLTSIPVVLGIAGGLGLLAGPAGLLAVRTGRDTALTDPAQTSLDVSFGAMLAVTSATGLALLAFRGSDWLFALLVLHLACVFALFLMLPYGKFVHGIYRLAALTAFADRPREHS